MKQPVKILYIGSELETITALERNDYLEIHSEPNGLKAFKWMTNNEFRAFDAPRKQHCYKDIEAIICEINLPGLNGLALFQEMKKNGLNDELIFILIVDKPNERLKKKSLALGVNGYLLKPVSSKLVFERIAYLKNFKLEEQQEKFTEDSFVQPYRTPIVKRLFDIVAASFALVLLSPLMILTAIAIRFESKGPAIYKSKRIGANFKSFNFYKFRSMYHDADRRLREVNHLNQYVVPDEEAELLSCPDCAALPDGKLCSPAYYYDGERVCEQLAIKRKKSKKAFLKIHDDPRVTKMGKLIRNASIDELPQLFNVLKGDMSIVGNRPLPEDEANALTKLLWSRRFRAAAGLTGLWQVEFRIRKGFMSEEKRFILDNKYAQENSFFGDLLLLMRTIPVIFQKINV